MAALCALWRRREGMLEITSSKGTAMIPIGSTLVVECHQLPALLPHIAYKAAGRAAHGADCMSAIFAVQFRLYHQPFLRLASGTPGLGSTQRKFVRSVAEYSGQHHNGLQLPFLLHPFLASQSGGTLTTQ